MVPDGLLHDWFYAIPADILALSAWDPDLVFPVSIGVYFLQYIVLYTGVAVIFRLARKGTWRTLGRRA
jgi:hypothetical protein